MKKVIVISLVLTFFVAGCSLKGNKEGGSGFSLFKNKSELSVEEAKTKAADFIDNNLVQPGNNVTIKDVIEEDGLYKMTVVTKTGQEVVSYLSKDGKRFYPQVIDIAAIEAQAASTTKETEAGAETADTTNVTKQDKAKVELFVMSHCPYGTQIEKGIIPVIEALGNKMDFELKFCDYAMHGEKELKEELNQYCIQKNEPTKLVAYLKCFLEAGDGDGCLTKAGINKSKLSSCVSATDKEYKVTEGFNDKSTWANGSYPSFNVYKADNEKYGVGGSPTLVINGKQISSGRDAKSLLATICAGFNTQPDECQKALSSDTPAAGFGTAAAASGASDSGGCN